MTDIKMLGEQIKKGLKQRKISQSEFASKLKVSLPTLKRWLNGNGVLLQDWMRMLDALDITLTEIARLTEGELSKKFSYTLGQEEALAREEGLLAFFDSLLSGKTVPQISRRHSLDDRSVVFYLSKLEKIGLIEWLPKNKAKLIVSGEPNWIKNGPLSKKFRRKIVDLHLTNHIDEPETLRVALYSLGKVSGQKVQLMMNEFVEKVRTLEVMDNSSSDSKKLTTVVLGVGVDEPDFLTKIPKR